MYPGVFSYFRSKQCIIGVGIFTIITATGKLLSAEDIHQSTRQDVNYFQFGHFPMEQDGQECRNTFNLMVVVNDKSN